tara:strand:+ start:115 stop:777 length:663 start_codon:yes stop_codon:yes gene_type:complete
MFKENKGFSLIELVVVVGVLSILGAIGIPSFTCFTKKSRAVAALSTMKQIIKECEISSLDNQDNVFQASNPNGYQINAENGNSCLGQNGFISIIPLEQDLLPTFRYDPRTKETSYEFKGKSGTQLSNCLNNICSKSSNDDISTPCFDLGLSRMDIISCQLNSGCICTEIIEDTSKYSIDVIPGGKNYWDEWENGDTYLEDNFEKCDEYPGGAERWCPKDS